MNKLAKMMSMEGRVAIVTGGAGHIGKVCCLALMELGAYVFVLDKPRVTFDLHALKDFANQFEVLECDLADEASTRNTIRECVKRKGRLDSIIHSAAYVGTATMSGWAVPFEQQSVGAWDAAFRLNLTSAFVMAQEASAILNASGKASIVFISSIYGSVAPNWDLYEGTSMANPAAYGASKAGLEQLTRYLATTLAPSVRVNCIAPGGIERNQPEQFQQRYCARTPLRRMGREEDMAGAVAYLASDLSNYVTGQILHVDGGWSIW
jgi:NAD(P)-dependent dehydrogenase (short-subunit alcohol dehydrogenase family)